MTGSMIGVSRRIAGLTSIKVPIIKIITQNMRAIPHAGIFREMKKPATICGTFCMVSTQVKIVVKPMISMMEEEEINVFLRASHTAFQVSSLYTKKPTIIAYNTAAPALSEAVHTPKDTQTMMNSGIKSAGIPDRIAWKNTLESNASSFGCQCFLWLIQKTRCV